MKKTLLLAIGLICLNNALLYAQKDALTSAFFYQKDGRLDKAKEEIDRATTDESTKVKAKTWYFRGTIYQDIAFTEKPEYKGLSADPIKEAYEAFKKTIALDTKSGEYTKSSNNYIEQIWGFSFNDGVKKYQAKDFTGALKSYEMSNTIKSGDTLTLLYIAYAAEASGNVERVKSIYQELFTLNRRTPDMYRSLSNYAQKEGKQSDALRITQEGRKFFPTDKALAIDELALISATGDLDKSISKIEEGIVLDPTNASLYLSLGSIYDKQSADSKKTPVERTAAKKKALEYYAKTLEYSPDNVDANYNIGVNHFNEGVTVSKKVNDMTLNDYNKFGKKLEAQAKDHYVKALPFFERSYAKAADDKSVRTSLKRCYLALGRKPDADKLAD